MNVEGLDLHNESFLYFQSIVKYSIVKYGFDSYLFWRAFFKGAIGATFF